MSRILHSSLITAASAVIALACATPSYAQEQARTVEGVTYVSGGIGEDSRDRLNSQARDYNLKLLFTLNEGNFLADLNVTVTNAKGKKVIEDVSRGPFFMAKLPAGTYTVSATHEGKTQTRKVQVGSRGSNVTHMRWPSNPQTDSPVGRDQVGPAKRDLAG